MMKKFIAAVTAAMMLSSVSAVAFAAYDKDGNSYTAEDTNGFSTVLIYQGNTDAAVTSENIYYIDQSNEGTFNASVKFLLKDNPAPGTYTVKMGGNGAPSTTTFEIMEEIPESADAATAATEENEDGKTVNMAFTANSLTVAAFNEYKNIFVTGAGSNTLSYPLKDLFKDVDTTDLSGNIGLGVQINNIPSEYKDTIKVSFGK